MEVPKRLLLTWKTSDIPDRWKETVVSAKNLMPDWDIVITTDIDNRKFVNDYYPKYLHLYDNMKYGIMRADFIRYLQLHKYGGVYHDLDICPVKSYNDILRWIKNNDKNNIGVYLVKSGNGFGLTNSFIASIPGKRFWLDLVEECLSSVDNIYKYINKSLYVLNATGPVLLTRVAKKYDHIVLPTDMINPYNMIDAQDHWLDIKNKDPKYYNEKAFTRPLSGSSWVPEWQQMISTTFMRVINNKWIIVICVMLIILVIIIAIILVV